MRLVHLTASTFYGGPERQMFGLAHALRGHVETMMLSFAEGGRCGAFIAEARRSGFSAEQLWFDTPHWVRSIHEIADRLHDFRADVLLCHGYKADMLGRRAAERCGVPAIAVSRGWTAESLRVRFYEALDRRQLQRMNAVVAVSDGHAAKVRAVGIPDEKLTVIRNASRIGAFPPPSTVGRAKLQSFAASPGDCLIVTAARLSPEKGIHVLVDAARRVISADPEARFIVFGGGAERLRLEQLIETNDLGREFSLAGFCDNLDELLPNADLMALPSFTEGLPNVVLEASAAGVPVVATCVGGTPEAIVDGETGLLVPSGDAEALSQAISKLVNAPTKRKQMGEAGREFVRREFSFSNQARQYLALFDRLGIRQTTTTRRQAA